MTNDRHHIQNIDNPDRGDADFNRVVSIISADDMDRYRQCVSGIDVPTGKKDEIINIVHSIMSHFVDQAFFVQTDQITLQSNGNSHLRAEISHDNINEVPENKSVIVNYDGEESDSNLSGWSQV